jgi:hypothetical protein
MVYNRLPWKDRFKEPSPADLRGGLEKPVVRTFDRARDHLRKVSGVRETVGWYGQSGCWTLEYRLTGHREPFAVLIPSPEDLQLAMPLEAAFITTLPLKRMKRGVRDGLELANEPFDTNWGVWSLAPDGLLEDLKDLLDRRVKSLC